MKIILNIICWFVISNILYSHGITDWELLVTMLQIALIIMIRNVINWLID